MNKTASKHQLRRAHQGSKRKRAKSYLSPRAEELSAHLNKLSLSIFGKSWRKLKSNELKKLARQLKEAGTAGGGVTPLPNPAVPI